MKNKILGVVFWIISLAIANLILFCFAEKYNTVIWTTFLFLWIAYVSQLLLWFYRCNKNKTISELYYYSPVFLISIVYLILQLIYCIVFSLSSSIISIKLVILINSLSFLIAWILIVGAFFATNIIKKTDSRQKNNHIEL